MSNSVLEPLYPYMKGRFHDVIMRVRIGEARAGADEHAKRQKKVNLSHNPTESSFMQLQSCELLLAFQNQAAYWWKKLKSIASILVS